MSHWSMDDIMILSLPAVAQGDTTNPSTSNQSSDTLTIRNDLAVTNFPSSTPPTCVSQLCFCLKKVVSQPADAAGLETCPGV
jgi:hypothetical protein